MGRVRLRTGLGTLMMLAALVALALAYARQWQLPAAAAAQPGGPAYRIASAVIAGRATPTQPRGWPTRDVVFELGVVGLGAWVLRRAGGRRAKERAGVKPAVTP